MNVYLQNHKYLNTSGKLTLTRNFLASMAFMRLEDLSAYCCLLLWHPPSCKFGILMNSFRIAVYYCHQLIYSFVIMGIRWCWRSGDDPYAECITFNKQLWFDLMYLAFLATMALCLQSSFPHCRLLAALLWSTPGGLLLRWYVCLCVFQNWWGFPECSGDFHCLGKSVPASHKLCNWLLVIFSHHFISCSLKWYAEALHISTFGS